MRFRCERDVLADALALAGRGAGSRGALAVLSGVKAELTDDRFRLTGTDLELTITVERTVAGEADGAGVLPARLTSEIVRALPPGAVSVAIEGDQARIAVDRSHFTVRTLPVDDFPRLVAPEGAGVTLPSADFADALRQVVRAASTDDARPILTGVLMAAEADGLQLVATDSYRLAVRDLPGTHVLGSDQKVLVPSRALNELSRVLATEPEVTLRLGERDVAFEVTGPVGQVVLTSRLIEGEFPKVRQLIPAHHANRLTVGREPLLDAIRRVRLVARESASPSIRLAMSADGLELSAIDVEKGEAAETLDAKYEGTEMTVAFNPLYLQEGVEACTGDEVTLETLDALKPAVVRSAEQSDYLYLLMPVRVP